MEIERKWLVDKSKVVPQLKIGVRIEHYYLNTINDEWLIFAKRLGSFCLLSLKSQGLMSMEELDYEITEEEYEETIKHAVKSICKSRFYLVIDEDKDQYYNIDVYDNYDFITCEVKFNSEIESLSFVPADWCVEEVTDNPNYMNVILPK